MKAFPSCPPQASELPFVHRFGLPSKGQTGCGEGVQVGAACLGGHLALDPICFGQLEEVFQDHT